MERVKKGIRHLILLIFFLSVTVLLLDRSGVLTELQPEREEASHRIVDAGTAWYYLEEGEDPGVGNVWTTERYRRGSWKELTGPYSGKGTSSGGEESSTAFFRTEFTYRPEEISASFLSGRITYRDAVKVYLNGSVIFAGNVPDGGYESNLDSGAAGFLFLTGFPIGDDCFDMRRSPVFKAYASVLTHGAGETKEEENSFRIQFSPEDREADFATFWRSGAAFLRSLS